MIRVAVVGLGRIGAAYDYEDADTIRTHVGAVRALNNFSLCAAVDSLPSARDALRTHWPDVEPNCILADMSDLNAGQADIIAICTPTATRMTDLRRALALSIAVTKASTA